MHIKSLVIDGFKSYGRRVEIQDFDKEFNAITGLNGTGKSNILDAICFALNITNLKRVRVSNLQELVYKSGQAGVTRASVTIVFDNRDKTRCPIGYENHNEITITRKIIMGGKSKYLINGSNSQNNRINDLFCSVQLNVNNPTFIIMQGTIMKVLSMKPKEILGLVDEAAGTKMYETKKSAAQNTITKKDDKLRELNSLLDEVIIPRLEQLKQERSQYQEFQKIVRELENLTKLNHAWMYLNLEEDAESKKAKIKEVKKEILGKEKEIENNKKEAESTGKVVADLQKRLDMESGGELEVLGKEVEEKDKQVTELSLKASTALQSLKDQTKDHNRFKSQLKVEETTLVEKTNQLNEADKKHGSIRGASEQAAKDFAAAEKRLLEIKMRVIDTDGAGSSKGLEEQLAAVQKELDGATTEINRCLLEKKNSEESIKKAQREVNASSEQYNKDQAKMSNIEKEIRKLDAEMEKLNVNEAHVETLRTSHRQVKNVVLGLREKVDGMGATLHQCNLQYSDPEPNFNRSRIHGPVCRLMTVTDAEYCTALETTAGGKLYNIVVDTDLTGKLLLQRGQLQKRITIIPLNKIHGNVMERHVIAFAKQLAGPENVDLALSLITYEDKLKSAMEWIFGQTLICKDLATAKQVCYHPKVMKRCVTLAGEVLDPKGTLYGGGGSSNYSFLRNVHMLKQLENDCLVKEAELGNLELELSSIHTIAERYSNLKHKRCLLTVDLDNVKGRMHSNTAHEELETCKKRVKELSETIERSKKAQEEKSKLLKELTAKIKDAKGYREREVKDAESEVERLRKLTDSSSKKWSSLSKDYEALKGEIGDLMSSIDSNKAQLEQGENTLRQLDEQLQTEQAHLLKAKNELKSMNAKVKVKKDAISQQSKEIVQTIHKKDELLSSNSKLQLKIKELDLQVANIKTELAEYETKMRSMERTHTWILSERKFFGTESGLYDFRSRDPALTTLRIAQLSAQKAKIDRAGINARAHTLLGKEEEIFQEAMRKKRIVEEDRTKLFKVIADLDELKKESLLRACECVNRDFGSIYSSLLPSAHAKLDPPPGKTRLDGLEVKVGFNNVWKDSMELSGGQRSLVALSLVLAMLLFNPAPLYILDEVDAALDLSHTQNIGTMLKNHFKNSQFIIVSLKDGMYSNASVLFKTSLQDGMSHVTRTASTR